MESGKWKMSVNIFKASQANSINKNNNFQLSIFNFQLKKRTILWTIKNYNYS